MTEAIILAGGLGTRLRGAVPDLPKSMASVAGRPFLAYLLQALEAGGIRRVVLAVGYKKEAIQSFFGTNHGGLKLDYSVEQEPLGTGGALQQALELVQNDYSFVLNGDTFLGIDYPSFAAVIETQPQAQLAVALRPVEDTSRYGEVVVARGRIQGFRARGVSGPGLINAGCYLVARNIFERDPMPLKFSWESDFLEPRAAELQPIAFECDAPFIDIGVPEALAQGQTLIPDWISPAAPRLELRSTPFSDPRLGPDLLWRDLRASRFASPTPALFLDRDGVIIEECEYISDPNRVELLAGIAELIGAARELNMAVIEVTNQAGIGRGYLDWRNFVEVENRTSELLAEKGGFLDAAFACPFHPEGRDPYRVSGHLWRKPNPGMLLEAARLLNLDLTRSLLVGDKIADHEAALAAGLANAFHVLTGHGGEHESAVRSMSSEEFPIRIAHNPREAAVMLKQAVSGVAALVR